MKLPQCIDHVEDELVPIVTKIKHRHLTDGGRRILRLRNCGNIKQRWAKAQGMVSK